MQTLNPAAAYGEPLDLHRICERARRVDCSVCNALAGDECVFVAFAETGWHVGRFARAMRAGYITGPELVAVLYTVGVFTPATLVWDTGGRRPAHLEVNAWQRRTGGRL